MKAVVVVNNIKDSGLSEDGIKEHCAKSLAMHKIPRFIEFKERMELSSAGKKVKGQL